ncbi:MAG: tandem-95 repeat protein [Verrucomicrobiae bacterium]|nr:tandem-95 repeat protein [Verrucomicrobiae bacterium]
MGWALAALLLAGVGRASGAERLVTLAWDPNPEFNLTEYRVHYGFSPNVYVATIPVGLVTRVTLSLPVPGIRYHFAVSAVNTDGLESDRSNVVPFTARADGTPVELMGTTVRTPEDEPVTVTLSAGLAAVAIEWVLVEPPRRGRLSGSAPVLTYHPAEDYWGTDSFRYIAMVGSERIVQVTTSLIVEPVPDPPVAFDRDYGTAPGVPVAVLLEAFDVDSPVLTYQIVQGPTLGQLSGTPPALTYTPGPNFAGEDQFVFRAVDEVGLLSNPARVRIREEAPEPLRREESLTLAEDTSVPVPMRTTGEGGIPIRIEVIDDPEQGRLEGMPPSVTYHPDPDYAGSDGFRYLEIPETGRPTVVTVVVTVTPVNDAPVAMDLEVEGTTGASVSITLVGMDVDLDPLTYRVVESPANGWLTGVPPELVYQPQAGFVGEDVFRYVVSDGLLESEPATVRVWISRGLEVALRAGTSPGTASWELEWQGREETTYRVLYKATISAPEWVPVGTVTPMVSGAVRWPVEVGGAAGFYAIEATSP